MHKLFALNTVEGSARRRSCKRTARVEQDVSTTMILSGRRRRGQRQLLRARCTLVCVVDPVLIVMNLRDCTMTRSCTKFDAAPTLPSPIILIRAPALATFGR